jgi:hypothetical protein
MPTLTWPVQPDGLVVEVLIGADHGQALKWFNQGTPIPRPILVRGIMDTGADVTAVAPRLPQALGLPQFGSAQTHTASGLTNVALHEISLSILPANLAGAIFNTSRLVATELTHAAPGTEVLVGLDVLLQGTFILDGHARTFSFTF